MREGGGTPVAVRLVVTGRVQGVGFRYYARREARRLGIGGWVRNREDGSVEALACGTPDALTSFEEALRRGPPGALVRELRRTESADGQVTQDFDIVS